MSADLTDKHMSPSIQSDFFFLIIWNGSSLLQLHCRCCFVKLCVKWITGVSKLHNNRIKLFFFIEADK